MTIIKKDEIKSCQQHGEKQALLVMLVELEAGTSAMENSTKFPPKIKSRTTKQTQQFTRLGIHAKEMITLTPKDIGTPMFIAALFQDIGCYYYYSEDRNNLWYVHTHTHKDEYSMISLICGNLNKQKQNTKLIKRSDLQFPEVVGWEGERIRGRWQNCTTQLSDKYARGVTHHTMAMVNTAKRTERC